MENRQIPFTKAWNYADGSYGEKTYWLNPEVPIKGIEACKLKKEGNAIECTKVFYETNFIILIGTPSDFFKTCQDGNTAIGLLHELDRNGLTIKKFLEQCERFNSTILT